MTRPWFLVLPNHEGARTTAERARRIAARWTDGEVMELEHPSGRPFVLGHWRDGVITRSRDTVVVRIGDVDPTHVPSGPDLIRAPVLRGSAHLLVSAGGKVQVRGTASGNRRVFHAEAEPGIHIASDRSDVLAALVDAGVDPVVLAVSLLSPTAPWPLSWQPPWQRVRAVEPSRYVDLGTGQDGLWWKPPVPSVPLAEAGTALHDALDAAVSLRTTNRSVACDLSGLDSSSLFGLATRHAEHVITLTHEADDPVDEDLLAAKYLVGELQGGAPVTPITMAAADAPYPFEGMDTDPGWFDEPTWVSTYRTRYLYAGHRARAAGATIRLGGHGGDELLMPPPAWLGDIARKNPLRAARLARSLQAKYRFRPGAVARLAMDRTPYADWFATSLRTDPEPLSDGSFSDWQAIGWGFPARLPGWCTPEATALAQEAVAAAVPTAAPLAETRGMHVTLEYVYAGALPARHLAQLGDADGLPIAAPFYDDHVLEACLAVRPDEAIDPRRYKPQLVEAMRGVLPERVLRRTSKAEASMTAGIGWRRHRGQLLDLVADSRLARAGLVDADTIRRVFEGPFDGRYYSELRKFLTIEVWWRTQVEG